MPKYRTVILNVAKIVYLKRLNEQVYLFSLHPISPLSERVIDYFTFSWQFSSDNFVFEFIGSNQKLFIIANYVNLEEFNKIFA